MPEYAAGLASVTSASAVANWLVRGAVVSLPDNKLGAIRVADSSSATVEIIDEGDARFGQTISVPVHDLTRVRPNKRDKVRVIEGENLNSEGHLIAIDGKLIVYACLCARILRRNRITHTRWTTTGEKDGIVKMDDADIKILPVDSLVRIFNST